MALAWTPTASPPINDVAYSTYHTTFSAVDIGTASADRIVVVGVCNAAGSSSPTTSVTIGGVAATLAVQTTSTQVSIWYLNVTSGTSADIVVTATVSLAIALVGIEVGILTGAASAPSSTAVRQWAAGADPTAVGPLTVPTGGIGIPFIGGAVTGATAPVWTNATGDNRSYTADGNSLEVAVAHTTTTGSITPSVTGFPYAGRGMVMAVWEEAAATTATGAGSDEADSSDSGTGTAPASGAGSETADSTDSGVATAPATGAGTDSADSTDFGTSAAPATGAGSDSADSADSGAVTAPAAGIGADSEAGFDAGVGVVLAQGHGQDTADATDAGIGIAGTVRGPFTVDTSSNSTFRAVAA